MFRKIKKMFNCFCAAIVYVDARQEKHENDCTTNKTTNEMWSRLINTTAKKKKKTMKSIYLKEENIKHKLLLVSLTFNHIHLIVKFVTTHCIALHTRNENTYFLIEMHTLNGKRG